MGRPWSITVHVCEDCDLVMAHFFGCHWCESCGNGAIEAEARLRQLTRRRWLYSAGISLGVFVFYVAAARFDVGAVFVALVTLWVCFIFIVWPTADLSRSVKRLRASLEN